MNPFTYKVNPSVFVIFGFLKTLLSVVQIYNVSSPYPIVKDFDVFQKMLTYILCISEDKLILPEVFLLSYTEFLI